jgi:hypothetical protein
VFSPAAEGERAAEPDLDVPVAEPS